MYIESLSLDGFKSYAKRTRIDRWDPYFNAITGLNGSGKSNLLDAICFVLGISSLSHVRASNYLDLVYKRGQAGVSKASATIVFNNEDKERSPPGYEDCPKITLTRQIIVNGRNKYIINGHNKSQHEVATFFHSVQLNVNNPHFLIMQGKIIQVLNMKPMEILSIIEEASGTRMFEDKKHKAMLTLEKKDEKLMEINLLFETEISPKLLKLKKERRNLLEFKKIETELSDMKRLSKAFEYTKIMSKINRYTNELSKKEEKIEEITCHKRKLEGDIEKLTENIQSFTESIKVNSIKLKRLNEELQDNSKKLTKFNVQKKICYETISDEERKYNITNEDYSLLQKRVEGLNSELVNYRRNYETYSKKYESDTKTVTELEEMLQSSPNNNYIDVTDWKACCEAKLRNFKQKIAKVNLEINRCNSEIDNIKETLHEKQTAVQSAATHSGRSKADLDIINSKIRHIADQMSPLASVVSEKNNVKELLSGAVRNLQELKNRARFLESKFQLSKFDYESPTPDFDRSTVMGPVVYLFRVKSEHANTMYALEICAGPRLFDIVVKDEHVASLIIKHGKLKKRHTFIPLNKIQPFSISGEKIEASKRMTRGNTMPALDLVEFDSRFEPAMRYVFGSTFICNDKDSAKIAAFDKFVGVRSITLEGDTYDPSGQLTGGSQLKSSGILGHVSELRLLHEQVSKAEAELSEAERRHSECEVSREKYTELENALELEKHQQEILKRALENNLENMMAAEVKELSSRIAWIEEERGGLVNKKEILVAEKDAIEKDLRDYSDVKVEKTDEIRRRVKEGRKALGVLQEKVNLCRRNINDVSGEIAQVEVESAKLVENVKSIGNELASAKAEHEKLVGIIAELEVVAEKTNKCIEREKELLSNRNETYNKVSMEINSKKEELNNLSLELQVINMELEKERKTLNDYNGSLERLIEENAWIPEQKDRFNKPNTEFDFSNMGSDVYNKIKYLREKYNSLYRTVDRDAGEKFERIEKREVELRQMLNIVKRDRKKIQTAINTLDMHKFEAIKHTWKLVNVDFGAIFGEILPGSNCKLQLLDGQDISKGFEICVNLGGEWSKSLTELSGGQRSLVALSLILALLRFKPAPIYILDEIDSALDISHTQNIGHLLKTRFKGSQFILVSLKEEMFNNANVVFRVKFRDGNTIVERIN